MIYLRLIGWATGITVALLGGALTIRSWIDRTPWGVLAGTAMILVGAALVLGIVHA